MKPVFQDKFYVPGVPDAEQRGNCWPSAIASILEYSLEDMPEFMGEGWFNDTVQFLWERGYAMYYFIIGEAPYPQIGEDEYYLVSGKSPRGDFYHVVVHQNGKMVHDPHPSGAGIRTEEDIFLIREGKPIE